MPINLANINISLQQFQKVSSGKFNAGEIRITGRTSLGKVNDHVSRIGKNTVPLSHEEVMAVKGTFIKALLAGGVGNDEIDRVRREIGLAPDPDNGVDHTLGERSMKPLTRQQVREILDPYDDGPVFQMVDRGQRVDKYKDSKFAIPQEYRIRMDVGPTLVADLR